MPVSTQYVKFIGRKPSPDKIRIAMQGDHHAEILHLDLPCISEGQCAILLVTLPDGSAGDAIMIDESGNVDFTRTITQFSGLMMGYVQINVAESIVWHSDILYLEIGALPSAEQALAAEFPTAFEQAIERMASLLYLSNTLSNETADSAREAKSSEIIAEREAGISEDAALRALEHAQNTEIARNEAVEAMDKALYSMSVSEESMNIAVHKAAESAQSAQSAIESEQKITRMEASAQRAKVQAEAAAEQAMASAAEAARGEQEARQAREYAFTAETAKEVSVASKETAVQAKEETVRAKEETVQNAIAAEDSAQSARESEQEAIRAELSALEAKIQAEQARDIAQEYGQQIVIEGSTLIIGGE